MKKILAIILIFWSVFCFGEISKKEITKSGKYIFGFAQGKEKDWKQLDEQALTDLSSQIFVQVKNEYVNIMEENNGKLEEISTKILETYTNVMLPSALRFTEKSGFGKITLYRYMEKIKVEDIIAARKRKTISYAKTGFANQKENSLGLALKNYYWSLVLLNSLPDKNKLEINLDEKVQNLNTFLLNSIQTIINEVDFKMLGIQKESDFVKANLQIFANNKEVQDLSLSYDDDNSWVQAKAKGGSLVLYISKFYWEMGKKIKLKIDYKYEDNINQDEEVASLFSLCKVNFDNVKEIDKKGRKLKTNLLKLNVKRKAKNMIEEILEAIKSRKFSMVKKYFTDDGFAQFVKIMNYGNVALYEGSYKIDYFTYGAKKQIRSIPLVFDITTNKGLKISKKKIIRDDLVLIFDEQDKIAWVNFAMGKQELKNNLQNLSEEEKQKKMLGINFMEYYKTLFCLKDADKIADLFSEDAKIFIGYVAGSSKLDNNIKKTLEEGMSNDEIKYKKYGKEEYINSLKNKTFKSKYVNLQFDKMDIVKRGREDQIYSLQLLQNFYCSGGYSDRGYLLLFANYTDKENPKIFYRYWQPKLIDNEKIEEIAGKYNFK